MNYRKNSEAGLTMVELMIVVIIIGILAAIGIPAFQETIKNNRRTVTVNEIVASLALARAEGAKRSQTVSVCGTTSGGGISCTGGTNWSHGWIVFIDANDDGYIASTDDLIKQYVNDYPDVTVTTNNTGRIRIRALNQMSDNHTLNVCDSRGASKARAVVVSTNGRARVSETATCS